MDIIGNQTGEFGKRVTTLDITLTTATSCLSIIGAFCIFLTYLLKWRRQGTVEEAKHLLIYLTISDLFIAIGNLIGAIRFLVSDDNDPTKVLACRPGTDHGCVAQSFITTLFSMCSFFWTTIIAFHFWSSSLEDPAETSSNNQYSSKRTTVYHILSWIVPLSITCSALGKKALGSDMSIGSGAWCWISACLTDNERTMWMVLTGKGWEILMYFTCMAFYILLKMFRKIRQRKAPRGIVPVQTENTTYQVDTRFLFLWLIELGLRIFGTVRFIMAVLRRHIGYTPDYYEHVDKVFMHIQSVGDSGQAFSSFLLFCVFTKSTWNSITKYCSSNSDERTPLLDNDAVLTTN